METWCFLGILFSPPHNKADVYLRAASKYVGLLIRTNYTRVFLCMHYVIYNRPIEGATERF